VFVNLIFLFSYLNVAKYFKKSTVEMGCKFSFKALILPQSVTVVGLHATEAYSSSHLIEAIYNISKLSVLENKNVRVLINTINFIACKKST
jgi:hypothetical protein